MVNELFEKQIEQRTKVAAAAYDKATAYANIIILSGYAGSFTLWKFSEDLLDTQLLSFVGLLLAISITTFVVWEVYKMIITARDFSEVSKLLQIQDVEAFILKEREIELAYNNRCLATTWIWRIVIIITLLSGLSASGLLMFGFITNL